MPFARTDQMEMLDRLDTHASSRDLTGNLRDIRLANRWFGGTRSTVNALKPLLSTQDNGTPLTILDIATGSADIPAAIAEQADRKRWSVRIVATDLQPEVVAVARASERPGRITVEQADALALPYPDAAFDVVTLSLALHHFEPDGALRVLTEMGRVARRAMIVNDLERSRAGYTGAWLFGHLLTRNPMTRHDAPLSVRRAYTPAEALALARAAGWQGASVRRVLPFRYLLTGGPA